MVAAQIKRGAEKKKKEGDEKAGWPKNRKREILLRAQHAKVNGKVEKKTKTKEKTINKKTNNTEITLKKKGKKGMVEVIKTALHKTHKLTHTHKKEVRKPKYVLVYSEEQLLLREKKKKREKRKEIEKMRI